MSALALLIAVGAYAVPQWLDADARPDDRLGDDAPRQLPPLDDGSGSPWIIASGGGDQVGSGPLYRYRVEVERATGLDAAAVAEVVDYALGHPRGWTNTPVAFQRVGADSSEPVEMVVRVATPATVDQLCAPMETNGEVSCQIGIDVVLNLTRWTDGVDAFAGDVDGYRVLLINHEVGHLLGHTEHVPCPADGWPSPVMMQVYYSGLQGCTANVWPYDDDGTFLD